ncbi:phosphatidylinositol-glycan biosynthesis class F protein-like [Mercenaria mercenaria]|uniref:phosphatidylinositol-glycan biosynthesis class F protein-like n=1 Tax=Mercenaria mercenaria TaxID=6596 RepID=UPI00234F27BB|nr:phosphatidylinositol-glycan biosynthesis class F protein-like [Mercenaria mercenaria]
MAAPLVSSNSVSKKTFRYTVLGNVSCAVILICLTYIPLNGKSQIDIVYNPFTATKFLSALVLMLHCLLHFTLPQNNKGQKFRLGYFIKDLLRCVLVFALSVVFFYIVAVLFGAAFTSQTAETFHFAMMLSSTVMGPLLIHLETNADTWSRVLLFQSPELGTETTVFVSSITSLIGAWLGAFPIPLDWDRPWQAWPITCVVGTLTGHCVGIILASIYISLQFYKVNKFKLT